MNPEKDIFFKKDDQSVKEQYYKMVDHRLRALCMENRQQLEYIKYLEYILDQNRINYYHVHMM